MSTVSTNNKNSIVSNGPAYLFSKVNFINFILLLKMFKAMNPETKRKP